MSNETTQFRRHSEASGVLNVLYLEDNEHDRELVEAKLKSGMFDCRFVHARTRQEFEAGLLARELDIILSDYAIPAYSGANALALAMELRPDVPFLFVSGTIGEERAVESLKSGATDYVIKEHLERLAPAVRRALREARDRFRRRQAEKELRASEERYRMVFESAPIGVINADAAGNILRTNRTLRLMLGYAEAELQNVSLQKITHPEDLNLGAEQYLNLIAGKIDRVRLEKRYFHKAGSLIWVQLTASAIRDSHGQFQYFVKLVEDLTEKKNLEAQFLRAQRLESIGTLASGIAHDLNNILAPISIAAQILRMKPLDQETEDLVNRIEGSAHRGAEVVRQVLTFARGMEGERALLQPRHLIREIVGMAQDTFPKSINLTYSVAEDLWPVVADATQLHQVLLNLFVNARDAMPAGGELRCTAENALVEDTRMLLPGAVAGPYVLIEVKDTGPGIPDEIKNKIFEPFFTTKGVGKGTGLGLSTVLGIVKSHGGSIIVRSEPGKGAAFKIYLPATVSAPVTQAPPQQTGLRRGHGELILIVDDESAIRDVTRKILVRHGYNVVTAVDGVDGLAVFSQQPQKIELVLTDIMMPRMEGIAMIRALKQLNSGIKIIASSGLANPTDQTERAEELKALGIRAFLPKPCTAEKLLATVHDLLAQ